MALTSLFKIAAREALKKGASKSVHEDIMSGTIRRIKQEAQLPKTPSRVFGKDPEKYTGPHSDFVRPERGLKSLDEPVDISKKLRTGDKEKVIDEIGEAEEISKATIREISPKKTIKAYKLFRRNPKTGELFPLFVKMGDNNPIAMNKWIQAEEGLRSSTGKVKSSLGDLAYRPGFHAGDIPIAKHIGDKWNLKTLTKDKTIKKPNVRPENQVWAEVEFADDVDWQTEAIKRAIPLKSGKGIQAKTAHITDQVPTGGNYRYKTNPNMEGEWIIGGEMKVNRVLSDKEVKAINKKAGTSDLPRLSEVVSKRKVGKIMAGGLSNLKKSININGQPHSLAWINPDEASVLKAMGGSGKPGPMGIPSYQETDAYDYSVLDTSQAIDDFSSYQDDGGADIVGGTTVRGGQIGIDQGGTFTPVVGGFGEGDDPGEQGAKAFDQLVSRDQNLMERAKGFFTGRPSDEKVTEKQSDLMNKAYQLGYGTWRNTAGRYSRDPEKDYDKWFADQDPTALIAGFQVGDPVGKAMQQSFDIVSTQLQNKFKAARDDKAVGLDDDEEFEMTREELQDAAKDIKDIKDFTPYSGIDYPWYMPGGMLAKGINFLSSNVIGTGTVGGVGVHVNKDGTVTPISPEDSPGFDHEAMEGENVEAPIRRRIPQQKVSVSESITEEEPLTGMKGLLARRSKPSTRIQSNTFLSNLLDDIYGSDREKLLG